MKFYVFFFFSGWLVIMTIFVWLCLPETKGVPIEAMERVFRCGEGGRAVYSRVSREVGAGVE